MTTEDIRKKTIEETNSRPFFLSLAGRPSQHKRVREGRTERVPKASSTVIMKPNKGPNFQDPEIMIKVNIKKAEAEA